MDLRKLKTLIDLVSDSNVSELEITEAEGTVRIVKSAPAPVAMVTQMAAPVAVAAPVAAAPAPAAAPAAPRGGSCACRSHGQVTDGWHVLPFF